MNKPFKRHRPCLLFACAAFACQQAAAHVGLANLTTPISAAGQATFAVAGTTNEVVFHVPHGCTAAESVPAYVGPNLDTYRIEVTVPTPIVSATTVAALRPAMDGLFGAVTVGAVDTSGNVKLTWTRRATGVGQQNRTESDNHLYKLSVRLRVPNPSAASDVSIRKFQFPVVQTCTDGTTDYTMDWGAESPSLVVFPDRRKGFNRYTLDGSAAADFTTGSTGTLAASLRSYFGDAAIVWVGRSGFSANPNTQARIQALAAADSSFSDLAARQGATIAPTDTIWVKY